MSVILPAPSYDEFTPKGEPYPNGPTTTTRVWAGDDKTVTLTLGNLQPGHRLSVRFRVYINRADKNAPTSVIVGDTVMPPVATDQTYTETVAVTAESNELQIIWTNVTYINYNFANTLVTDLTPLPDNPLPADVLALHALLPVKGIDAFRLGTSRLGRDSLNIPALPPNLFRLGVSKLGTRRLYYEAALMTWQDILPPCTQVKCWRGVDTAGPIKRAKAGTLTATALDALDPRVTGLHHGTPIRLIHWPTRTVIFTGSVVDLAITPHRPDEKHSYTATLTAADAVADLVGITRYGAKSGTANGQETWSARIKRLFESAPKHTIDLTRTGTDTTMCPTVWETSLANHIDAAVTSVAGYWYATRTGTIRIADGPTTPDSTDLIFTDETPTDLDSGIWSYTGTENAWTASATITSIKVSNHDAKLEEGEWRANDTETLISDHAAAAMWSGTEAAANTTLLPAAIPPLARSLLRAAPAIPLPSAITLSPANTRGPNNRADLMARAATVEVMSTVTLHNRHETSPALIAAIEHEITPKTWTTNLTLTNP